jgi:ActR/RegA family two-component response regulator
VDDDSDFLQLLRAALKRESYDLVNATSARSALEILRKEVVDVVVTDENMPGMSGTDLLAIVADEFPACGRIILTGHALGIWGLPYSVIEAVAYHHQPQRVSQSYFDVLAALTIAQSLVRADDGSAFDAAVPANSRVDESYLISVKAPFDWSEARRRVADTTESKEVAP